MANYDIPDYPIKRLRYFNNQFLIDQDFIDSEVSQIGHERAVLRSLCVAGVCEGLTVTYPATNKPPSISAGVAIDRSGRMIVVAGDTDAVARPDALADGDYVVHIRFFETEDDKASGQGAPDYTRWKQTPVIDATLKTAALPDGAVVLGSCTVLNKAFVGSGTTAGRQYSGLRLPGPNRDTTATLRNTGAANDLAVLAGSLTIRKDSLGKLGPTLTLMNGGGGAGAGGAIDFDGYDPGANDPTLRVQSLDDGSSSSHLAFLTKDPGGAAKQLVERMRLTSDGVLKLSNVTPKDKLVFWETTATDRFGLGLNSGNINLFCPPAAHFSLRQNSSSGTEVFTVDGSGNGTFKGALGVSGSGTFGGDLVLTRHLVKLGTTDGSQAGANEVVGGIGFLGTGRSHGQLSYRAGQGFELVDCSANAPRVPYNSGDYPYANLLLNRLNYPNALGDKLVIYDNGSSDRYGLGLNGGNISLFYPTGAHFSLRQASSTGTEVFTVDGTGMATFSGAIVPKVGNDASSGIQFPANPGGGGGDEAFLRYSVISGETTQLVLGINNDADDALVLWQAGAARLTITGGDVQVSRRLSVSGAATFNASNWNNYAADATILMDNVTYKSLMIVGSNQNQGHSRWVRMWDDVQVEQHLTVNGKIGAAGWSPTGGGHFPAGWGGGVHTWDLVAEASVGYSNLTQWSSIHAKTEIQELTDALATLDQLSPVLYERTGKSQAGLIAEEVREVFPRGAHAGKDEFFAVGIQPDALLALTIAAVQELSARVRELSRNDRGAAVHDAPGAREAGAGSAQPDAKPRIEILREGTRDAQHYLTARFHGSLADGESRQVVRTVRIPDAASRDQCLEAEYEAWQHRIAGRT